MKTNTKVKTNLSRLKTLHSHTAFALMDPKEKMTLRLDLCQIVPQLKTSGLHLVSERKIDSLSEFKLKIPDFERGKVKISTTPLKYSGTGIHTLNISRIEI